MRPRLGVFAAVALTTGVVLTACSDESDDTPPATGAQPTATATQAAGVPATSTTAPSATPPPSAGMPESPSNVTLAGPLPDLQTPVPPGQGELGRLTIEWQDKSANEDGFRIYQECDGRETVLLEVPAGETSYGPLQTCRPGRLGVAAFNAQGESEIAWAP